MSFHNLARMYTTTAGTGTVTLTTAVPGCLTFALAGVANGEVVKYGIITYDLVTEQPTHTEVGIGTYTAAGTTLSRDTVEKSTNADAKIVLTGLSEVYIAPLASDFNLIPTGFNPFASYYNAGTDSINDGVDNTVLTIATEWVDQTAIATLAANVVTINLDGWYMVTGTVRITSIAALNGYLSVYTSQSTDPKPLYPITSAGAVSGIGFSLFPWLFPVNPAPVNIDMRLDNHTGQTLDCGVYELTIRKIGDL